MAPVVSQLVWTSCSGVCGGGCISKHGLSIIRGRKWIAGTGHAPSAGRGTNMSKWTDEIFKLSESHHIRQDGKHFLRLSRSRLWFSFCCPFPVFDGGMRSTGWSVGWHYFKVMALINCWIIEGLWNAMRDRGGCVWALFEMEFGVKIVAPKCVT